MAIELWSHLLQNKRVIVNCDYQSVVGMINKTALPCIYCMKLIRIITLTSLNNNIRFFADYVRTDRNVLANSLSRMDFKKLWSNVNTKLTKSQWNCQAICGLYQDFIATNQKLINHFSGISRRSQSSKSTRSSRSSASSKLSIEYLLSTLEKLKQKTHTDGTSEMYCRVWCSFNKFIVHLNNKPDQWEDRISLFVTYLIDLKREPDTIKKYSSAIKSILHDEGN